MMCQFHSGTMDRPNPWRVIGLPRGGFHSNPMTCCRSSPGVGCHASHSPCLHGNPIACCHETEMLRQLAGSSWPLWTPALPAVVSAANKFVDVSGYRGNGASGCRSNVARKSMTSFSISAILGSGPSSSERQKRKEEQTTKTSIIRPWDDEVSNDPSSCSREWRISEGDEEDMEVDGDDEEEEEEEIDVGGQLERQGKAESSNCPLDALLRMTSQTHFLHQRTNTQTTTTSSTTIDYTSDDSGGSPQFTSQSKTNSIFHRSSHPVKKRRKTRTAFTNHQIFQLEKRFLYQKYLTPTDRDELALSLRLSNSQVITWFQNRRAKLKRDLEELKADVSAAKALGNEPSTSVLSRLDELIKANDCGLKKKDRTGGDTCRSPIIKSPPNNNGSLQKADEETAVTSTTVKDTNSLC